MKNSETKIKYVSLFFILFLGLFVHNNVSAATIGETRNFNVDSSYDSQKRKEISATLVAGGNKLYFYVDSALWQSFSDKDRIQMTSNLFNLFDEFDGRIYPVLISNFGSEWNPGIDKDSKITVLFHPLRKGAGGYFNEINEYSKFENPYSNEREMVYLNADYLASSWLKSLLAHEFTHLITFNQKERIQKIKEDIWLNEARAEYAVTLLGYNDVFQGSYLQKRVNDFLKNPDDPLIEWDNSLSDYGPINLFILYLVDHYGINILNDSLHYNKAGIESINYALGKNGYKEDFSQIFTNWTITALINDCSVGSKYCYRSRGMDSIKVLPTSNFVLADLPSDLTVNYSAREWTGNWQRILADRGLLAVAFNGAPGRNFKIAYVLCDLGDQCLVEFLNLDENNQGKIDMVDSGKYPYFILIPTLQDIDSSIGSAMFFLNIKTAGQNDGQAKQQKINFLKSEITRLQAQLAVLQDKNDSFCEAINGNLYFGMSNNSEVRCLQKFLKSQTVYPEGLITGNFLALTKSAVIRFQEKYASEILNPLGLEKGTGYVGERTRDKINQFLVV
ncbi:MAG: hypothetical protein A3H01_01615 [Candidatus Wildermuthbacteria bacterium RIFCSPLOWO2_12_FULL_40_9]|uniref:Peptidoglycan binding-like domain-containing protein n=2 Tax=Candidatus Wildermuthiibacteriota TaxID=1817923 RepID=A0A1G2RG01_9BACT|nr:MAG: hypothetical protein A3F15_01655 [Candidatus Wildermuthbacteria bacterium RIFCSPHIGHO2_12_FULL_40_12]OHA76415.1 MAG: hypothetical protein A3H01_01615 [Candidatus Wildermuthbacteria bacterium RIFCSPLOWO2_12_FULL_40_9]